MRRYGLILSGLFYIAIITLILTQGFKPIKLKPIPLLLNSLVSGTDQGYILRGHELKPFKPHLPVRGTISFIMDFPYGKYVSAEKLAKKKIFFHDAKTYLAPLTVNTEPTENVAIFYCSNADIAEARLAETGYRWQTKIADGKGVAVKTV